MRDGVALAAVVITPELPETAPPPPCVVATNGYSGLDYSLLPHLRELASGGYAVVLARLRGVAPSEGTAGLYEKYGVDGHDVIEWAAAQPFTNGRIGMVGPSLLGLSQWLAAKEHPEHLVVVTPDDSPNNTYEYLWYVGGLEPGPGRKRRSEVPGVESEYSIAAREPWFNGFWRERSATREDIQELARRGLPALMSSGWDSYMLDAASRAYTWMRAAGAGSRARLVIGPWRHGSVFSRHSVDGDEAPGEMVRPRTGFDIQLLWLNRWLRDEPNGIDERPPVLIYVQGPDRWRYENDWPLPDESRVRMFLADGASGTSASLNDGRLSRAVPEQPGRAGYRFDPATSRNPVAVSMPNMVMVADGEPRQGPSNLPPGSSRPYGRLIMDKTPYEEQALTWTSSVFAAPAEITGYPTLVVWASVSSADATFIAEITDVGPVDENAPGGADRRWTSTQVTRGYLRAGAQFSRSGPTELRTDDVCRFDIELSPTSYVVPSGHRIRVVLQGAAIDPAFDISWQGPGLSSHEFSIAVRTGPGYASYTEIPFIGGQPTLTQE